MAGSTVGVGVSVGVGVGVGVREGVAVLLRVAAGDGLSAGAEHATVAKKIADASAALLASLTVRIGVIPPSQTVPEVPAPSPQSNEGPTLALGAPRATGPEKSSVGSLNVA